MLSNNTNYVSEEDMAQSLKEKYIQQIEENSAELLRIITLISDAMVAESADGIVAAECRLDSTELQVLAMKIPAICTFMQSQLSALVLESSLDDVLIDLQFSKTLTSFPKGKEGGTVAERTKRAEMEVVSEKLLNTAQKQYIKSIQDLINRADKVYEGIKKTLDYRARELWLENKT